VNGEKGISIRDKGFIFLLPISQCLFCFDQIRNKETSLCLDTLGRNSRGDKIGMMPCHGEGRNQVCVYLCQFSKGEIE
jgi:hypothetical protein